MIKALTIALLVTLAVCNMHLNAKYSEFLHGGEEFSHETARKMYGEFRSQHFDTPSQYRYKVFVQNLIEIRQHNRGGHSWTQGVNDLADLTFEEFSEMRLMEPQHCSATGNLQTEREQKEEVNIPEHFDWTEKGVVTPVKNQGNCGSCWTFSTVGTMESHWNILKKGVNQIFAEQQLVDCAGNFDNHGCNGGLPSHAFEYIRYTENGLMRQKDYPYTAKNGKCVYDKEKGVAYAKHGSFNITQGDENQLAEKLFDKGPISIAFDVINGFQRYHSGVYTSRYCGKNPKNVNHAVVAVGYGVASSVENGLKFWNIKNSWGASWGQNGYFKMERDVNMCAVAQCNSYPLIDSPAGAEPQEATA